MTLHVSPQTRSASKPQQSKGTEADNSDSDSSSKSSAVEEELEEGETEVEAATLPLATPNQDSRMPDELRRALEQIEAGEDADPFLVQEALAWQPDAESLESVLAKAKETKGLLVGALRQDVVAQEPNVRYWQGSPEEFSTPWGPLTISEMVSHKQIGPVLQSLLDFDALTYVVEHPKVWQGSPVWNDLAPGGKKEGPLCVVGARVYSGDQSHKGCFQFMVGTITVSRDRTTRGQVHFVCQKLGCPGNNSDGVAYKQLTLNAWFAKQSQLHMQKHGRDELKYMSFLTANPMTLGQIWMAHECVVRKAATDNAKNSEAFQRGVKTALLAGGETGLTTPSSTLSGTSSAKKSSGKLSGSKASALTQVAGQQKLSFKGGKKRVRLENLEEGEPSQPSQQQGQQGAKPQQQKQQPQSSAKKAKKAKKKKKDKETSK